ncbi:MAG: spore photoproduct lyase family protein, partial [Thermodesulfobacteriota bacterium]
MAFPDFQKILIEKGAEFAPLTQKVLAALPGIAVENTDPAGSPPLFPALPVTKRTLLLTRFKGELVKPCPGTKEYICCGYRILHVGSNCPLDCSYCILQGYFNQPYVRLFVNTDEIFHRLHTYVQAHGDEIIRLGTGEFTDSLALDHLTGLTRLLRSELERYNNVIVELKTKTVNIQNLLQLPVTKKIIVAWSLNPPKIIGKEEPGAATLEERIQAAALCQKKGYLLGFHFDPIFYFSGWEELYEQTIGLLFSRIRPENIAWISLGCFRFLPPMKGIIERLHPRSSFIHQEFIPALDNKMRYPQPRRVEMY